MLTEADLDLLEMYLDDALSDRDLADVARRIAQEPEMAAELHRMQAQRDLRRQVFASLEPNDATVDRLLGRVDESIRRRSGFEKQLRWGRWAAAAAACVLVGFTTGYLGRAPADPSAPGIAQNTIAPTDQSAVANSSDNVQRDRLRIIGTIPPTAATTSVQLTDNSGRVVAVQHFESPEKAREFVKDIRTWQDHTRRVQSGDVQLMGGKF